MKKTKVPVIPDIYENITIDKKRNAAVILEDTNHQFFLANSVSMAKTISTSIHKIWNGINQFLDENANTLLAYHEEFFGANPPKGQSLDQTAIYTWAMILTKCADRTKEGNPINQVPTSVSPRAHKNLLTRRYYLGNSPTCDPKDWPPQMVTCFNLLNNAIQSILESDPEKSITEEQFHALIVANAAAIKTRQDPWRIFQYYRPQMMKAGMIRAM